MPAGMVGMPTPAGHQSELNYIYGLVEELSKQLAENRRQTEEIVLGVGRVRNRARTQALGNEELINAASDEINGQEKNLDAVVSILTEALEKAKYSRDANAALLNDYARSMGNMVRQLHDYKANQVVEVSRWHRSYRDQLAEEREENARLREQIWGMNSRAARANEMLREFRNCYEESEERWGRRVDHTATRGEIRFWKRMAMPEIPDDDPYWSDDDDLIDIKEKIRLRELEQQARDHQEQMAAQEHEEAEDLDILPPIAHAHEPGSPPDQFGGVAMQRDETSIPPRPDSAASTGSTGSSGQ